MDRDQSRLHWLGFGLVLLVTQAVYLQTMTISCPFWDSGEFIATSYILGIPHPPGTPLYVLIGRFFSVLPLFPEIATRVNWLSALASSLTAAFTYLAVVELWWRARRREAGGLAGSEGGSAAGPGRAAAAAGVELDAARVAELTRLTSTASPDCARCFLDRSCARYCPDDCPLVRPFARDPARCARNRRLGAALLARRARGRFTREDAEHVLAHISDVPAASEGAAEPATTGGTP